MNENTLIIVSKENASPREKISAHAVAKRGFLNFWYSTQINVPVATASAVYLRLAPNNTVQSRRGAKRNIKF